MRLAKTIFWIAGLWGFLVLVPLYFLFDTVGIQSPPPVTHPEYYFGFISVGLAFQLVFFIIAADPCRFCPMMLPSMVEKFGYFLTILVLHLQGRVAAQMVLFGCADLILGLAFLIVFLALRPAARSVA